MAPAHLPPAFYTELLPRLAIGLLLALLVLLVALQRVRTRPQRLLRARREQGRIGEQQAMALLDRAGYAVIGAQHAGSFTVLVDGHPWTFALRADFLVRRRRDGRLLLAEVKTGAVATRLQHGPTRRQLLEYALAYREQIAGVLLVAPEHGQVTCVHFPDLSRLRRPALWKLALCAAAGGGLALAAPHLLQLLRRS